MYILYKEHLIDVFPCLIMSAIGHRVASEEPALRGRRFEPLLQRPGQAVRHQRLEGRGAAWARLRLKTACICGIYIYAS